ncbi:MAG TPA: response regulator [Nitrospiria bacterium]|jgi:PAS domain S-box-containing protein
MKEKTTDKTTVLIVEDETIVAKHLQKALKKIGYHVPVIEASGEGALKSAEHLQPDIVLIDILLKGRMDGIEAARHIKDQLKIPVVFLTAFADETTLQRAKQTGPYGYLIKPFQERELNSTIKISLHRQKIEVELETRNKWLSGALSNVTDAVIATDKKGRVIFMNPLAEQLTGVKQELAIGKDLTEVLDIAYEILHKETHVEIEKTSSKAFQDGIILNLHNKTILRDKTGKKIPIHANFSPMRGDKGDVYGGVVVFQEETKSNRGRGKAHLPIVEDTFAEFHRPLSLNLGKRVQIDPRSVKAGPVSSLPLTRREIEILCLLSRGMVAKEIADSLNLSNATVRTHIQRILQKLKVHSKLEAVVLAFQKNFIEIPPS